MYVPLCVCIHEYVRMCACMLCACVYTYICLYLESLHHVVMHVSMRAYVYVHVYKCIHIYLKNLLHVVMHACMCVSMRIYMYMCVCTYICIFIYTWRICIMSLLLLLSARALSSSELS